MGLGVLEAGSPTSSAIACSSSADTGLSSRSNSTETRSRQSSDSVDGTVHRASFPVHEVADAAAMRRPPPLNGGGRNTAAQAVGPQSVRRKSARASTVTVLRNVITAGQLTFATIANATEPR